MALITAEEIDVERQRVKTLFEKWVKRLGLGWWTMTCTYSLESPVRDDDRRRKLAECNALWQYLDATITFYLPVTVILTDDELETAVIHELIHVLVNELQQVDEDRQHEERVVTTLTMAIEFTVAAVREEVAEKTKRGNRRKAHED